MQSILPGIDHQRMPRLFIFFWNNLPLFHFSIQGNFILYPRADENLPTHLSRDRMKYGLSCIRFSQSQTTRTTLSTPFKYLRFFTFSFSPFRIDSFSEDGYAFSICILLQARSCLNSAFEIWRSQKVAVFLEVFKGLSCNKLLQAICQSLSRILQHCTLHTNTQKTCKYKRIRARIQNHLACRLQFN
ncbi:hypothetical protein AVEN_62197-1 [Araneus ventricosus]|uniref:Uncharacterized protein n=1 Tax=Araneus ventricosus TaxID=182803 RepID=A0A4Y2MA71_ARAVE|nr:hypothetical protein AVEN_62197-1 [Araneus ventricosus]